jgi:hypothetical protein
MAFAISKQQQKLFVEQFMEQALTVALDLVERGRDKDSPGATLHAVGHAIIREIHGLEARDAAPQEDFDA